MNDNYFFEKKASVAFRDCDASGNIRISSLLNHIVETAGDDYDSRGYGYETTLAHGQAYLLSRLTLAQYAPVRAYDSVSLITWEAGAVGACARRDFEMRSKDGELLAAAACHWILIDTVSRRILRPSAFYGETRLNDRRVDLPEPSKIALPDGAEHIGTHIVRYSEIDSNGHIYSANYGDIFSDALPKELQGLRPVLFEINYTHESTMGDELELYRAISDGKAVVCGVRDGKTCFAARAEF